MIPDIDYYLEKLISHRRVKFFKFFPFPKSPILFIITTILFSLLVVKMTNSWIPAILGIYVAWEHLSSSNRLLDIAEQCVIDEMCTEIELKAEAEYNLINLPEDPLYVVESDREYIVDDNVSSFYIPFLKKLKIHYQELVLIITVYLLLYSFLFFWE